MQVSRAVMAWISAADEGEGQFRICYLGNVTLKPQQQQNQNIQQVYAQIPNGKRGGEELTAFELLNHQEPRQTLEEEPSAQNARRIWVGRNSMTST